MSFLAGLPQTKKKSFTEKNHGTDKASLTLFLNRSLKLFSLGSQEFSLGDWIVADIEPFADDAKLDKHTSIDLKKCSVHAGSSEDLEVPVTRTLSHEKFVTTYRRLNGEVPLMGQVIAYTDDDSATSDASAEQATVQLYNVGLRGLAPKARHHNKHRLEAIADHVVTYNIALTQKEQTVRDWQQRREEEEDEEDDEPRKDLVEEIVAKANLKHGTNKWDEMLEAELKHELKWFLEKHMTADWLKLERFQDGIQAAASSRGSTAQKLALLNDVSEGITRFGAAQFENQTLADVYKSLVLKLVRAYMSLAQQGVPEEEVTRIIAYRRWDIKLEALCQPYKHCTELLNSLFQRELLGEVPSSEDLDKLIIDKMPEFVAESNVARELAQQYVVARLEAKVLDYKFKMAAAKWYKAEHIFKEGADLEKSEYSNQIHFIDVETRRYLKKEQNKAKAPMSAPEVKAAITEGNKQARQKVKNMRTKAIESLKACSLEVMHTINMYKAIRKQGQTADLYLLKGLAHVQRIELCGEWQHFDEKTFDKFQEEEGWDRGDEYDCAISIFTAGSHADSKNPVTACTAVACVC